VGVLLSTEGDGWNKEKMRETFFQADVAEILKIPVGHAGTEDYLAWNYTKNGVNFVSQISVSPETTYQAT
jgi:hypothetical protein